MTDRAHRSRVALPAMTLAFVIAMLGTTLPTAIYHDYQQGYGLSPLMIVVIYAVHVAGVIGALMLAGNWSDRLGRRRLFGAAVPVRAGPALLLRCALSGISAGIFTSTASVPVIGTGLLDRVIGVTSGTPIFAAITAVLVVLALLPDWRRQRPARAS